MSQKKAFHQEKPSIKPLNLRKNAENDIRVKYSSEFA